jgi:hypothetical protein
MNLNLLTLKPGSCQVRDETPNLKTENVVRCYLAKAFYTLQETVINEYGVMV